MVADAACVSCVLRPSYLPQSKPRTEARSAFGDETVFLEPYVDAPRHIEVQIFGDTHGNIVHLLERECSIQRRHQKIVEEAPSPALDEELRAAICSAAVRAGEAIGYTNAGTVEFLLGPDRKFYFLEVNTRLQVEHPVTEEILGLDLVHLQILVAEGHALPQEVWHAKPRGHAIEVRLYAEDPAQGYAPSTGRLHRFDVPTGPGVRLESGVIDGSTITSYYDPMLAKLIVHAPTRTEAARALSATLARAQFMVRIPTVNCSCAFCGIRNSWRARPTPISSSGTRRPSFRPPCATLPAKSCTRPPRR